MPWGPGSGGYERAPGGSRRSLALPALTVRAWRHLLVLLAAYEKLLGEAGKAAAPPAPGPRGARQEQGGCARAAETKGVSTSCVWWWFPKQTSDSNLRRTGPGTHSAFAPLRAGPTAPLSLSPSPGAALLKGNDNPSSGQSPWGEDSRCAGCCFSLQQI